MSGLYCDDGLLASMPSLAVPKPKPERGAPWRPPDTSGTTCQRCGRASWQHRSYPPVLADEVDRAIYAAAFVAEMQAHRDDAHEELRARNAIGRAEALVGVHRRARSGT